MKRNQRFGVVDRIEGGFVIVVVGSESLTISQLDLPGDIKEGDSLDLLTYKTNKMENEKQKSKVRKLLQGIFK